MSPLTPRSTLITSAPRSPRTCAATGGLHDLAEIEYSDAAQRLLLNVLHNALLSVNRFGDEKSLNLIGALIDLSDLGVAHHPLHRIVTHIAVTAVQL